MIFLEQNLLGICRKFGIDFQLFLSDFQIDSVFELSVSDLEAIVEEYELDLYALLFKPMFQNDQLATKLTKIKLLILDVDGVMTDGGMYMTESGDQFKKFDTKDGRAIIELTKKGIQVGIISSGFKDVGVTARANMLGMQRCYIGLEPKLDILNSWCDEMKISLEEVAIIGDDINDLGVIRKIGFSACPADAVEVVKKEVDLILSKKGGKGCIREFVDNYFEKQPLTV